MVVIPYQQRSEPCAVARRVRIPTNHKFLLIDALEFQPVGRTATDVLTFSILRDYTLQPVGARLAKKRLALALAVFRVAQGVMKLEGVVECLLAQA